MFKLTGQFKKEIPVSEPGLGNGPSRGAAFFDVDGTLILGDTQEMEAKSFVQKSGFSPGYFSALGMSLMAGRLNRMGLISVTRQNHIHLRSYRGMLKNDLNRHAETLFRQEIRRRFFSGMIAVLEKHRAAGRMIVLVSATTRHLMAPVQALLRPDAVFCTDLEFDERGRSTGRALDGICAEARKPELMRRFARKFQVSLADSFAYSDHHSDLPMLSAAGTPVAVNPTAELASRARREGWEQLSMAL